MLNRNLYANALMEKILTSTFGGDFMSSKFGANQCF